MLFGEPVYRIFEMVHDAAQVREQMERLRRALSATPRAPCNPAPPGTRPWSSRSIPRRGAVSARERSSAGAGSRSASRGSRARRWARWRAGALVHAARFSLLHTAKPPPPLTDLPGAMSLAAWLGTLAFLALVRARGSRASRAGRAVAFPGVPRRVLRARWRTACAVRPGAPVAGRTRTCCSRAPGSRCSASPALAGLLFLAEHRRLKRKRPLGPRRAALAGGARPRRRAGARGRLPAADARRRHRRALGARERRRRPWPRSPHETGPRCSPGRSTRVLVAARLARAAGRARCARRRRRRLRVPALRRGRRGAARVKLLLVGMNHRTAPLELRERFAVDDPAPLLTSSSTARRSRRRCCSPPATASRWSCATRQPDAARQRLRSFFRARARPRRAARAARLDDALYEHTDATRCATCSASPPRSTRWCSASRRSSAR